MLQATGKLCCGIAHDHLPGLKIPAVAAILKDVKGLLVRRSRRLPSKIPHYIQRLMGKETATHPEPDGDVTPSQFSSVDLSYIAQGEWVLQRALSILQQHTGWQAETTLVLQRIGMDTLVTHEVTTTSQGNLVGQRDFVSVRHRVRRDTATYLVGTATHAKLLPSQEGCIRAECRLSCIVLQPLAGDPGRTHFTWLLSMDLKGWIPTSVTASCHSPKQTSSGTSIGTSLPPPVPELGDMGSAHASGIWPELETH